VTRIAIPAAFLGILSFPCSLTAQHRIGSIRNYYTPFISLEPPNSGIAQGAIFIMTSVNLPVATASQGVPLRADFAGVTITVTVGGVTTQAIPYSVSPDQIVAILPSATPVGLAKITVTSGGDTSVGPNQCGREWIRPEGGWKGSRKRCGAE
jgi:hypothetical protein